MWLDIKSIPTFHSIYLAPAFWVKFSVDDIEIFLFSFFSPESGFRIFMQIVSDGHTLHEMSNLVFWEK